MSNDWMADLRKMAEQIRRGPPPLVIQVSEAMPDDLVFDYTATSQAMEWERWMDGKWVRLGEQPPKKPKEHRVIMNGRTLDGVRAKHPEMFGLFGPKVVYSGPPADETLTENER